MNRIRIYEFTKRELDYFRDRCNFTNEELEYFNLKAKNLTNVAVSLQMNISISKVSYIATKVVAKIRKVIDEKGD